MLEGGFAVRPVSETGQRVKVAGWVYDKEDLGRKLDVRLFVDGSCCASERADMYNPNFKKLGIEDGRSGFELVLEVGTDIGLFSQEFYLLAGEENFRLPNISPRRFLNSVYFLHIPKTGGTSLRRLLESRVQSHLVLPDENTLKRFDGFYPPGKFLKRYAPQELSRYRLLRGHYHYDYRRLLPRPCITITVLREPFARTLSHINMLLRNEAAYSDLSVQEFIREHIQQLDNFQTRFLCSSVFDGDAARNGNEPDFIAPDRILDEADHISAQKNLRAVDFVGVQENIPQLINRLFPKEPRVKLGKENSFDYEKALSSESREILSRHLQYDIQLYLLAVELSGA